MSDFTLSVVYADGSTNVVEGTENSISAHIAKTLYEQFHEPIDNGRVTLIVTDQRKGKR